MCAQAAAIRNLCGLAIVSLSIRANPKFFTACAAAGCMAQLIIPQLSTPMSGSTCAAGCSGIIANGLGLSLNSDWELPCIVGTILFCGHINHCKDVTAATVGVLTGLRITHVIRNAFGRT